MSATQRSTTIAHLSSTLPLSIIINRIIEHLKSLSLRNATSFLSFFLFSQLRTFRPRRLPLLLPKLVAFKHTEIKMALTRLMVRANGRQTRSMTKASGKPNPHQVLPAIKSRRPPARKRRIRAVAARRASDGAAPISAALASLPAQLPLPVLVQEDAIEPEKLVAEPAASSPVSAPIDQPLRSVASSPIPEQVQLPESTSEVSPPSFKHHQPLTSSYRLLSSAPLTLFKSCHLTFLTQLKSHKSQSWIFLPPHPLSNLHHHRSQS